jgi:ketosteroid isomerase-like protein
MKGKLLWLLLPCLMVIALGMTSCGGNPALEVAKKWDAAMDDALTNGNVDALDEVEDPDVVLHEMGVYPDVVGREMHKGMVTFLHEGYVNYQRETMEITGSGDIAAIRYTERWTFSKEMAGFPPPTGKEIFYEVAIFLHIKDGKVVEVFHLWDTMRVNQGLGVVPEISWEPPAPSEFEVSGTMELTQEITDPPKIENGKLILEGTNYYDVHGTLEGTTTLDYTVVVDEATGSFTQEGQGTFTGTVKGKSGSYVYNTVGTGQVEVGLEGESGVSTTEETIISGTGDLANLRGSLHEEHQWDENGISITYSGMCLFEE